MQTTPMLPRFFRTLLVFILLAHTAPAQDFNNYRPLKSSGRLPHVFSQPTIDKVNEDIAAAKARGELTDATKKKFYVESHYVLDHLLQSGKVLTGDPISAYVNHVADTLLRSDPELRKQLHIYVIKSPYVNAYTLVDGYIFINIGLIAQLENEAQLAYILSHEIVHYRNKHSLNTFLEYIKIDRTSGANDDDNLEAKLEYSKEQETEADVQGLAIFMKSNYDIRAVMTAFDVMQYSYLPFDEEPFDKTFLEDDNLKLPDSYFLKETKAISNDDNFDDSKSTHPNVRKRKEAIKPEVDNSFNDASRKKFLVSETEFKRMQTISRFEMCRLELQSREYPDALYSSFLLQKKYPNSAYLKKITGKTLYNIAGYWSYLRSNDDASKIFWESRLGSSQYGRWRTPDYEDIEGNSQQVYHLLKKLDNDEAAVVALNYNWKLHKEFPHDGEISRMCDSLFFMLSYKHNLHPDDFSHRTKAELARQKAIRDSVALSVDKKDTTAAGESKYDKIRKQQETALVSDKNEKFIYFAFADFLRDEDFRDRYNKMDELAKKRSDSEKSSDLYSYSRSSNRVTLPALGAEKVVVVEPFALHIDSRSGDGKTQYLESEDAQEQLLNVIKTSAKSSGMTIDVIDPQHLDSSTTVDYNNMSDLKEWIAERMKQGNATMPFVIGADSAQSLVQKYGTKYFLWSGAVRIQKRKKVVFPILMMGGGALLLGAGSSSQALAAGAAGVGIGALLLLRSPYETVYYNMLFDLETGQCLSSTYDSYHGRDTSGRLGPKYSSLFAAIKKKKK